MALGALGAAAGGGVRRPSPTPPPPGSAARTGGGGGGGGKRKAADGGAEGSQVRRMRSAGRGRATLMKTGDVCFLWQMRRKSTGSGDYVCKGGGFSVMCL